MLPEQAANWAYPQPDMGDEEMAFCLVTGLLGRFYLSGYLNKMTPAQLDLVRHAVIAAKSMRGVIRTALPFWPLGMPEWDAPTVVLGLSDGGTRLISVWDRAGTGGEIVVPIPDLRGGQEVQVSTVFPTSLSAWGTRWDGERGTLGVFNPGKAPAARVFRLELAGQRARNAGSSRVWDGGVLVRTGQKVRSQR